jgi:hypothetical protein
MTHNQYSNLSNDIILMIIGFVHPGDLENFASVSQRNYNLSSEALAVHRARKKAFGVVNDTHPLTIPNLLASVIAEPSLAWYIRRLVISNRTGHPGWDPAPDLLSDFNSEKRQSLVRSAVEQSPFLANVKVNKWMKEIEKGDDEPFKTILLTYTSNLKSLSNEIEEEGAKQFYGSLGMMVYMYPTLLPVLSDVRLSYTFEPEPSPYLFSFGRDIGHTIMPLFGFRALKTFHVNIELLKNGIYTSRYGHGHPLDLAGILPNSIEKLKISGHLQDFMDPGEFLAWVTTNVVRKKGRGVSPVVPNLSAVCIASLADAWNRQNGIRDVDDTEYEPFQLKKLRAACDKMYVVLTDRIHGFGDDSTGHPCAVCNEEAAVVDADGKKWSPCRSR